MEVKAKHCFEVSWEVCNKVGGIYTVVVSKARQMIKYYGHDNYCCIGPYFPKKAYGIFEEKSPPEKMKSAFEKLHQMGIDCHYGTWLVTGNPQVILIDFAPFTSQANNIKKELWDAFQLDTMGTTWYDVDEPVVWSWAAGKLIKELSSACEGPCVAQFHEWLAGAGLLFLKKNQVPVGTIFTTHATMLGRTLASADINLYDILDQINPEQEARNRGQGLWAKYQIERLCAQNAGAFTTVSEITGMEAEKLLGRKPDVLLFNGLDMEKFPTFEESSVRHKLFKNKIFDFVLTYFFPYYQFDLDNTLIYFLSGRYEFHDKGIDVFIRALGKLNDKLKAEGLKKTVVVFFWVPGNIRGVKSELIENKTYYSDLRDFVHENIDETQAHILNSLMANTEISKNAIFDEEELEEIRRKVLRFRRKGTPPICTHDLYNQDEDVIHRTLIEVGLDNMADDRVKVVYYPIYLTGTDGLLNLSYYESMQGGHLGVFPSYYEPWGYTPLEAGALGVPSVTSDLAGFGRYICAECKTGPDPGIWTLQRYQKNDNQVVEQLSEILYYYTTLSKQRRIQNKITARKVAETCDWSEFVTRYIEAHNIAVDKIVRQ
jgi:glycogen(starch) synthase